MGLVATLSIVIAATAMTAFIVINSPYMPYDWYNASHVDALEKACIAGDIDRIKSLIEQDETLVDRVNQISGWAPIHHLIIHNHFDALTILSADPNVRGLKVCLTYNEPCHAFGAQPSIGAIAYSKQTYCKD
jgi:hypothetical protein